MRNYMNRPENAEYILEWQNAQTVEAARAREQLVPDWKYIYFEL